MSFKGCGPHSGGVHDVYLTPSWCVDRLLEAWVPSVLVEDGTNGCLEPCVGSGNIVRAFNKRYPRSFWSAWDINLEPVKLRGCGRIEALHHRDFLCADADDDPTCLNLAHDVGLVLTNPPYVLAEQFVRRARRWCPNAELMFLLRLGFLVSKERAKFYAEMGTPDIYVLPNRPSFTGDGKTDGADYAWFHWKAGEHNEIGRVYILGLTSKEGRVRR